MRTLNLHAAIATAVLIFSTAGAANKHGAHHLHMFEQRHAHHRHQDNHEEANISETMATGAYLDDGEMKVKKRSSQCQFPSDAGLVSVTPNSDNAGWAMSPDQSCTPGSYCPYACPPGQLSMQWDPDATSYTYPQSMNGGLYCDEDGNIQKPFPSRDYCTSGTGALNALNNVGETVAFCQTVLPGNEAMLIPTAVDDSADLAVPGPDYWCSTAAHYYVNNPGCSTDDCCIWGDGSEAIGNWSPYVAGANTDSDGNTFAKLGWNPIYTGSSFAGTKPSWGLEITCSGDGCNGLPCKIDPAENDVNEVTSSDGATGAGGADFCVVTIPQGVTGSIVIFSAGDASASASQSSSKASSTSTSTSTESSTSTTPTPTSTSTSTSTTSTSTEESSSSSDSSSSTITSSASTSSASSSSSSSSSGSSISTSNAPHVFKQNSTTLTPTSTLATAGLASGLGSVSVTVATPAATSKEGAASASSVSAGILSMTLLVALVNSFL